jgi:DNA-binding transcriptional MerR regulator
MGYDGAGVGERALLRIGQLAEATGESTKTLRFYDDAGVLAASAR